MGGRGLPEGPILSYSFTAAMGTAHVVFTVSHNTRINVHQPPGSRLNRRKVYSVCSDMMHHENMKTLHSLALKSTTEQGLRHRKRRELVVGN